MTKVSRKKISAETLEAINKSAEFYGYDPRKIKKMDIQFPKSCFVLGHCARLDYLSYKYDDKMRYYFHDFEVPPLVMASAKEMENGMSMIIIIGKFKIDDRGIVG